MNCVPQVEYHASCELQKEKSTLEVHRTTNHVHVVFTVFYVVHRHAINIMIICRYLLEL